MTNHNVRVWTIPNILTLGRILAVPFVIYFLARGPAHQSAYITALVIFVVALLTDQVDGYLSRKLNQQSTIGEILDPLADKILVMAVLIQLTYLNILPSWIVILLLTREIYINGLRAFAQKKGLSILPNSFGKLKVYFQGFALGFLIVSGHSSLSKLLDVYFQNAPIPGGVQMIGLGLLYISLGLSLKSAFDYSAQLYRHLVTKS